MREEWDRRIQHDYRFWMSDGIASDQTMWATGKRDLDIILEGLDRAQLKTKTALEIGCGVGRLLRAASDLFQSVVGIDVSEEAIARGRQLLSDRENAKFILTNGTDLAEIADDTIDFCYTFAALSSMPVTVIAGYLIELSRVTKAGAELRLQVYLGKEQSTTEEDTIAVRTFDAECFTRAVALAGFDLPSRRELVLPFQVSDKNAGMVAEIVTLRKRERATANVSEIERALASTKEIQANKNWRGSTTEYFMALSRAQQHMDAGELSKARDALQYALQNFGEPEVDVRRLLQEIEKTLQTKALGNSGQLSTISRSNSESSDHFERNMQVVRKRFPEVARALELATAVSGIELKPTQEGDRAIVFEGTPLDNPEKPRRAAELWAERELNAPQVRNATSLLVAGMAGGYHVEALLTASGKQLSVFEPRVPILRAALAGRDCTALLERIANLFLSVQQFERSDLTKLSADQLQLVVHSPTQIVSRDAVDELRRVLGSDRGIRELHPSIGVVSPIYGGSLPIAAYTARALQELRQRVQFFDLGSFYGTYNKFGEFLRDRHRIDGLQSYYVEVLSQVVLEAVTERPVDILICLAQAPLTPRVLTELRNRGIITVMWFVEDCRRFLSWKEISQYYDFMFLIQRDEFPALVERAGARKAVYLPVGCDPLLHAPLSLTDEERKRFGSQISFVGAGYNNRQQMFATLAQRDFKIWGTEWPGSAPFDKLVQENARRIDPGDYVKIFNASAVNLNLHSSKERDGVEPHGDFVNPRTFELASTGAFQLVDNRTHLRE